MPRRHLLLALALLPLGGVARGQDEEPPLAAWRWSGGGEVDEQPRPRDPLDLKILETAPYDAALAALASAGRWAEAVAALAEAQEDERLGAALLRAPGQPALISAREAARLRLLGLGSQGLAAYRNAADPRAQELLRARGRSQETGWWELATRLSASSHGAAGVRLLGEVLLERGDLEGAGLLYRRALREGAPGDLPRRLLRIRAWLGADRDGSVRPRAPADPVWQVRWARRLPGGDSDLPRPIVADGGRVYLTDPGGVLAVDRDLGLLVWRRVLPGEPALGRLALGRGVLVVLQPDRLLAYRASDGAPLWERSPDGPAGAEGRWLDVVATPLGFAALALRDGRRLAVSWSDGGRTRWELPLWDASDHVHVRSQALAWGNEPGPNADPARVEEGPPFLKVERGPVRGVVGDGRLLALGDRVLVTADGLVAALSAGHGGLLWLQDRAPALEVVGGATRPERVLVGLDGGPYGVNAVTAAGVLVRLDPLDGRPLPLPRREPGAPPPYPLALEPLVLLHPEPGGSFALRVGPEGRLLARLALPPSGPGAVSGGALALPDPAGTVMFDLSDGAELGELAWPFAPGPVQAVSGLLVQAGPDGVAVWGRPIKPEGGPLGEPQGTDPGKLVAQLDATDWRLRLEAQQALLALGEAARPWLERATQEAATLDGREQARELLLRVERQGLFQALVPRLPKRLLEDLVAGLRVSERLGQLRPLVTQRDEPPEALRQLVFAAEDPEVRYGYLLLLTRVDARLRRRLVDLVCAARTGEELREGAAQALVELAAERGSSAPLEQIVDRGGQPAALVLQLAFARDRELLHRLLPRVRANPGGLAPTPPESGPRARAALLQVLPELLER